MPHDQMMTPQPSDALQARYGVRHETPSGWNPVIATLMSHRSVRGYLPDALPAGTTELLVAAAQSAATSSNMQLWSVVAVQDQAVRDKLAILAGNQKHISEAPLFLLWLCDLSRAERIGAQHGHPMTGLPFTETFMVGVVDASLAAQNAVVAAESLGLGTVYIGSMRNDPEQVAEILGLPPQTMVVFGLCVGLPDPQRPSAIKPRLSQSVVLHHERYNADHDAQGVQDYEDRFSAFQKAEGMPVAGWVSRVVDRLGSVAGLGGRDRMRTALTALGFPLK